MKFSHHLNVVLFPDALLKWRWGEVDVPVKAQALEHPELVQLSQALPVPAHLGKQSSLVRFAASFPLVLSGAEGPQRTAVICLGGIAQ